MTEKDFGDWPDPCAVCGRPYEYGKHRADGDHRYVKRGTVANSPAAGPWIPVTERMPEDTRCVLVWDRDDGEHVAQWFSGEPAGWLSSDGGELPTVTHWAEITPPKGTEST